MQTQQLTVDPHEARRLHALYHQHRKNESEMDAEIRRAYKLIGQGKMIIAALASIAAAGIHTAGHNAGFPKLAIARADSTRCRCEARSDEVTFYSDQYALARAADRRFRVVMPGGPWKAGAAIVPMIPTHLRPRKAICSYHILWEADWKVVPRDPMLLRRLGGDMWIVVAAWDLTEVERAAMASRLSS